MDNSNRLAGWDAFACGRFAAGLAFTARERGALVDVLYRILL